MGCHEKAKQRYYAMIRQDPEHADYWLDQLFDALTRATEWDADGWGFNPTTWMEKERALMRSRLPENERSRYGGRRTPATGKES